MQHCCHIRWQAAVCLKLLCKSKRLLQIGCGEEFSAKPLYKARIGSALLQNALLLYRLLFLLTRFWTDRSAACNVCEGIDASKQLSQRHRLAALEGSGKHGMSKAF